ncbi:MAG: GNAT family N-acetyltransferase [Ilumatobacteraceae bacterium]
MDLRWLDASDVDAVLAASALFDAPAVETWARELLEQPNHHLCIADLDAEPAGFVTGIEMTHPDKGTEMFLYELGVDEPSRGRGVAKALVRALIARAEARGCYGVWTLTERANTAALATYRSTSPDEESDEVMLGWTLRAR